MDGRVLEFVAETLGADRAARSQREGRSIAADAVEVARLTGRHEALGNSPSEMAEVQEWMSKASTSFNRGRTFLPEKCVVQLNSALEGRTYLLGTRLTLADLLVYPRVASTVDSLPDKRKHELCNAVRWCMHMASAHDPSGLFPFAGVRLGTFQPPKPWQTGDERGGNAGKEKEASHSQSKAGDAKGQARKADEGAGKSDSSVRCEDMDIRVGKIEKVEEHPDAGALWVTTVNLGEKEGARQVVAGLRNHKGKEELEGASVLVWCNLKAANLKGCKSQGMILCATSDGSAHPIAPPREEPPGQRILPQASGTGSPLEQINPKRKEHEKYLARMKTDSGGAACFGDSPLIGPSSGGSCTSAANASVG